MTASHEVLNVRLNPELPESFKKEILDEITESIQTICRQHYKDTLMEADLEITVGRLYTVKWKLEGR